MGQTGSGKTELAELIADELGAQLINADAFQVYRGLDIGTNKPRDRAKYKLLDIVEPSDDFGAGLWIQLAVKELIELFDHGQSAVLVGGTGFYIRALMEEYEEIATAPDPALRAELEVRESECGLKTLVQELLELSPTTTVDLQNPVRVRRALERELSGPSRMMFKLPGFVKLKLATNPELESLERGLVDRVSEMWDAGWPSEVEGVLSKGVPTTSPGFRAIGYQSVAGFVKGDCTRDEAEAEIVLKTRQYAKRQRTWLRSEPGLQHLPLTRIYDDGQKQALLSAARTIIRRGVTKESNG